MIYIMRKISTVILLISILQPLLHGQSQYELYFIQGNYEKILNETKKFLNAEDYYWHSIALERMQELLTSIDILKEGLNNYPNSAILEKELARKYFQSGQFSACKGDLEKFSEDPEIFEMLVKVLEYEDNNLQAVTLLRERLGSDSLNLKLLVRLADNLYQIDSLDAALEIYTKISVLNPGDQLSLSKMATIHLQKKRYNEAIDICNAILEADSTNKKIIRIKGFASFRKGDFKNSIRSFKYLLDSGDSSFVTLKHLGISESKSFVYHDSRKHLEMAFHLDSNDREICFFLGRGYLNSTEPEKGLYFLDRADSLIQADPEILAAIYLEKASIFSTLQMYDEVLDIYLKALKINPRPDYLFSIASLYEHRFGEKKKAYEYYNRFLDSLPPREETDRPSLGFQKEISMKKIAEEKVEALKEELFFNGELD